MREGEYNLVVGSKRPICEDHPCRGQVAVVVYCSAWVGGAVAGR